MDQYKMISKVASVLTEATTPEKTSETANKVVEWFNKPGVKATGYILVAFVVVAAIGFIAYHGYKKLIKKQ